MRWLSGLLPWLNISIGIILLISSMVIWYRVNVKGEIKKLEVRIELLEGRMKTAMDILGRP